MGTSTSQKGPPRLCLGLSGWEKAKIRGKHGKHGGAQESSEKCNHPRIGHGHRRLCFLWMQVAGKRCHRRLGHHHRKQCFQWMHLPCHLDRLYLTTWHTYHTHDRSIRIRQLSKHQACLNTRPSGYSLAGTVRRLHHPRRAPAARRFPRRQAPARHLFLEHDHQLQHQPALRQATCVGQALADRWIAGAAALTAVQQRPAERGVHPDNRAPAAAVHHERHLAAGAQVCQAVGAWRHHPDVPRIITRAPYQLACTTDSWRTTS